MQWNSFLRLGDHKFFALGARCNASKLHRNVIVGSQYL